MDLSTVTKPQIVVSEDRKTATKYSVVAEKINFIALQEEKKNLEQELNVSEPIDKDLLAFAKANHPYYLRRQARNDEITRRIKEIEEVLKWQ